MKYSVARTLTILLMAACARAQPAIRWKVHNAAREAQTMARSPQGPAGRRPLTGHYILQFRTYPDAEVRAELARLGMRVLQYIPDNALMVSSGPVPLNGLDLEWAGYLDASNKTSALLEEQTAGAVLAVFHADIEPEVYRALVTSLGFDIIENTALMPGQLVISGPLDRLPKLAERDEVAYLLPASADLAAGVAVAGCAGAVTEAGPVGEYVLAGAGWSKGAGGIAAIQYFIRSLTDKLDPNTARLEIERALREWTRYTNLSISPGTQGSPRTIDILFGRGAHGDSYPFDGPGGSLAHTFYPAPPNAEPIAGDMHMDADEPWRTGASIDLFSVALHEAGHALGLGHSDRPGAVMYPYYRQSTGLSDDDIAAIRALYGTPGSSPPPTTPVHPPVTPPTPVQPPVTTPTPPTTPAGKDTTSPTLQIKSPILTIASTSSASIAFSGTASDNVAVTSVQWSTSTGGSGTATGTNTWSAAIPLLVGTNVVTVRAYDAAGNSGWRSATVVRR